MAASPGSDSLTAITICPHSQDAPSFSQQGQVDWIALSRMQFTASIAILGRLASAGIEPLTVAFGQAMCSRIPLGIHGERVLQDAMKKLVAFSSFGDIIWFGVGVCLLLRDLVQTSQGSALVALCAALTEGHSIPTSALVLYEIAKRSESPKDLLPSFRQWEALAKLCASVFSNTTFGLRSDQILRLNGNSATSKFSANHPADLAEVMVSIGRVLDGSLAKITVQGGPSCSWIAAWADFVLGLRIQVRSEVGVVMFVNYDIALTDPQILIEFVGEGSTTSIQCVGKTITVRSGQDFIKEFFSHSDIFLTTPSENTFFMGGRVQWTTMLQDTFGDDVKELLQPESTDWLQTILNNVPNHKSLKAANTAFRSLLVIGASIYVSSTAESCRYRDVETYLLAAMDNIPELRINRQTLLREAHALPPRHEWDLSIILKAYQESNAELESSCLCHWCHPPLSDFWQTGKPRVPTKRNKCLVVLTDTILYLSFILSGTVLDSALLPYRAGLLDLYERRRDLHTSINGDKARLPLTRLSSADDNEICEHLTGGPDEYAGKQFPIYATLFSAAVWPALPGKHCNAASDGKLYCYVENLRELSDRFEQASLIHVGSGAIHFGTQLHSHVFDLQHNSDQANGYPARNTTMTSDISVLNRDSASPDLQIEAVVEEKVSVLAFGYRVSSRLRSFMVLPGQFIHQLREARMYKWAKPMPDPKGLSWHPILGGGSYILVEGEGWIDIAQSCHILRPLRANLLGRCVAISRSQQPVALVQNDEELVKFETIWFRQQYDRAHGDATRYYVLIS